MKATKFHIESTTKTTHLTPLLIKLLISVYLTVFFSYTLKPTRLQHVRDARDQSRGD